MPTQCEHKCPMFNSDLATQIAADLGEIKGDVKAIYHELYGNGKPGVLKELATMQNACRYKHDDVAQSFTLLREQMRQPAEVVSSWKQRAIGAGAVITGLGVIVGLVKVIGL